MSSNGEPSGNVTKAAAGENSAGTANSSIITITYRPSSKVLVIDRAQAIKRSGYLNSIFRTGVFRPMWEEAETGIIDIPRFKELKPKSWMVLSVLEYAGTGKFNFNQTAPKDDHCKALITIWNLANYFQIDELCTKTENEVKSFLNAIAINLRRMKYDTNTKTVAWFPNQPTLVEDARTEFVAALYCAYAPISTKKFRPLLLKFLKVAGFRILDPESLVERTEEIPDFGKDVIKAYAFGALGPMVQPSLFKNINDKARKMCWRRCYGRTDSTPRQRYHSLECSRYVTSNRTFIATDGAKPEVVDRNKPAQDFPNKRHIQLYGKVYCEKCAAAENFQLI